MPKRLMILRKRTGRMPRRRSQRGMLHPQGIRAQRNELEQRHCTPISMSTGSAYGSKHMQHHRGPYQRYSTEADHTNSQPLTAASTPSTALLTASPTSTPCPGASPNIAPAIPVVSRINSFSLSLSLARPLLPLPSVDQTHIVTRPTTSLSNSFLWPCVISAGATFGMLPREAGVSGGGVLFRIDSNIALVREAKSCMKNIFPLR